MSDVIIIAVIAASGTVLSSLVTGYIVNSNTKYRVGQLEKKVDKHNNIIERMYVVEQSSKSAHHRIDEMCDRIETLIEKLEVKK